MEADVAMHFNPRIELNHTVLNSKKSGEWQVEEKYDLEFYFYHIKIVPRGVPISPQATIVRHTR